MTKWIMAVAVVLVVGAGAWWYFGHGTSGTPSEQATNTQPQVDQNGMTPGNDDQSLAQDSAAIDAQMQGLAQDSASADASLNDQPTSQAY